LKSTEKRLSVLFIAAEADPFVKVGGLGDVAGSLPLALKQISPDLDIRLAIPFYEAIHKSGTEARLVTQFPIPTVEGPIEASVYETSVSSLPVYLIDGAPIAASKAVYGSNFELDAEKFVFFSLACLYLPLHLKWKLDILQANDWHTAIALHELALKKADIPEFKGIKTIITLHNLPFMGTGSQPALQKFNIAAAKNPRMPDWARTLPLPMGINAADKIIAVSPTYAREILTPGFGCDLQSFLKTKSKKLSGILNGIDTTLWNPQNDPSLHTNYSVKTLELRQKNKLALQKEFGLKESAATPLFTFIGRLDQQKGVDLVLEALTKELPTHPWQVVFLGTGDKTIEAKITQLQADFPEKVKAALRFDGALSHRLYAGADILMMPSRYEPCGLAQMIAMRYGCVPVARATGGLVDTIRDYSTEAETATGFLCTGLSGHEFADSLSAAAKIYSDFPKRWWRLQENGMNSNFSWRNSAASYLELYKNL
jgi:glycogen/starch synthases, ADP-glucose type